MRSESLGAGGGVTTADDGCCEAGSGKISTHTLHYNEMFFVLSQ